MKHTVKRTTAAILAALILAGTAAAAATFAAPTIAHADEAGTGTVVDSGFCGISGDNVKWKLTSDGTLTISGTGMMKNFVSSAPWNKYNSQITSVVIENDVSSIGSSAFKSCSSLTNITIPSGVTNIGSLAFFNCTGLTAVIMEGTTPPTLGNSANVFQNCDSLKTIFVPAGCESRYKNAWTTYGGRIKEIPNGNCGIAGQEESVKWVFNPVTGTLTISGTGDMKGYNIINGVAQNLPWENYRTSIEKVVIESGITEIGSGSFADHTNLTEVTFAKNSKLKKIGGSAFLGCSGLTSITIPESVTTIVGWAFLGCTSLTSITIPSSVNSIGAYAFSVCTSLTSITLPSSVTSIEKEAFSDCAKLTTVTMERSTPPTLGDNIFESCEELNTIFVPVNALTAYQNACDKGEKGWKAEYKNMLAIGGNCGASTNEGGEESVKWSFNPENGKLTISGSGKMANYISPQGVPWYNYRPQITSVVIENGVTSIGDMAFQDCGNLTTITFTGDSQLKSIGNHAFDGCTNLTSITIPTSVTSIGKYAFQECTGLTSVTFAENSQLESIGNHAFDGCTKLTSVKIPTSVTSIGDYAFYKCIGLTSITIPEKVTYIGSGVFWGCTGLTSVTISEGVTKIGTSMFYEATALKSITIPKSVTSIGSYAFKNCKALKNIDLPEELTTINRSAFLQSGLTGVTIPKSVDFIGIDAFSVCEQLGSVIMERETPCDVGANIFGYKISEDVDNRSKFVKENTKGITVPYGSLEKYKSAENWSDYKNYMKEDPAPVSPAPSVPSQTTTQKPTIIDEDGNVITGSITTYPDGSVVDVTIVTKPNGDTTTTVVEKDPQGNTTKTTETKVETAADGTKTETETVTEAGKAPVITKTVTKKDGSQIIEKITSAENSRGNTVTTTETTVKDSKGNVVKKTTKKEIKNIGNGTDAVIDVDNNTAVINKIGAAKPKGMQATINNKVLSQLKEANNGKDLLLTMIVKDKDGNKRYSVEVDTADLTPKNRLYIYKKDSKTGELYMVNGKTYITDSKGQLKLIIRSKGDFVLKNAEDAAKINEKILATVQAKKNKATIAKGKTEFFAFHEDLDMRNVKSISYETSDPRIATVNGTGKIKGKKAGTATITATVTLKNGETKTVTMKVTVK